MAFVAGSGQNASCVLRMIIDARGAENLFKIKPCTVGFYETGSRFAQNEPSDYRTNPLFPASGPATRSFNGLHPKSKFLAIEIALNHEFCDQSQITREFHRETSLTPHEYRKRYTT